MLRRKPRDILNTLWEALDNSEELGVSEGTGIVGDGILTQLNIRVHALDIDSFGHVSMAIDDTPFLFQILPQSELRRHPLPEEMDSFHEYPELSESPETESPEAESPEGPLDLSWASEARARAVSDYITDFALNPSRKNLPPPCRNLWEHVGLSPIS